jgi:hypothetical protein
VSVIFINDIIKLLVNIQILRGVVQRIERHVLHVYSFVLLEDRLFWALELRQLGLLVVRDGALLKGVDRFLWFSRSLHLIKTSY